MNEATDAGNMQSRPEIVSRKLNIGTQQFTEVYAIDEKNPEFGNANHRYNILRTDVVDGQKRVYAHIHFQNGPIKENGVNGIHNEDLLAIVIDRLEGFQSGEFRCNDNHMALEYVRKALEYLNNRTSKRQDRDVEGTSEV